MRLLILTILALATAAVVGLISLDNPGLMVISYGRQSWEMPLVLAALFIAVGFALLYLLLNFLFGLLQAPKKAKAWNEQRQNKNAQNDTLRGYARLIEGDWNRGEKELTRRLGHSKTPMLNYLGAAYAAQQQQDYVKRDEYLTQAEKIDPKNRMAIDISRVRMLSQAGDFEQAGKLLGDMQKLAPANKTILRLKADLCERTADWEGLEQLLPRLKKTKAVPEAQLITMEVEVQEAQLSQSVPDENNPPTISHYHALPGKRKKNAQVAAMYARKLIKEGDLSGAESVVRRAINKNWNSELARIYGLTRVENIRGQIKLAMSWIPEHENDANVNLTLARLNHAYQQYDKARVYYNMAIELGAGDEAYFELGQFYEEEGNLKSALTYYKRGVEASIGQGHVSPGRDAQLELLDSVVTPGSTEVTLLADGAASTSEPVVIEQAEVEDAEMIEHKA